jgi:hypothetical protein
LHLLREEEEDADDDVNKEEERSKELDCDMMTLMLMLIPRELSFFVRFAFFSLDFYTRNISSSFVVWLERVTFQTRESFLERR